MGGNLKSEERSEFLSRLLDRRVDWREDLKLTSGQKARYFAWCDKNRVEYLLGPGTNEESSTSHVADVSTIAYLSPHHADAHTVGSIAGIGVDIQQISELFPQDLSAPKADESLTSIFSLKELSYAESSSDIRQTLTGIFAAKEAIIKACPNNETRSLPDIEILHQSDGAPTYAGFQLSISHSGNYAVAVAANFGDSVSKVGGQESFVSADSQQTEANRAPQVKKPPASRLRRILLWVKRLIIFLGMIGGLWVLVDKLNLLL